MRLLTRVNARIARACMYFSVSGLLAIVAIVAFQVFGRYVMNDSPTWTENLALVLILYVTLVGSAVVVRDAGHIGMESLLVLVPERVRLKIELLIHVLVAAFGALMAWNGAFLAWSVHEYLIPTLGISEGLNYVPIAVSGALILLFSFEHIVAQLRGEDVVPAWH